jgi:AbrB family looped-hinge helix DNA binding protein
LTLKLKVGKKGVIILPKSIREAVGIDEGDEVIVEVSDGIVLRPVRKNVNEQELKGWLRKHVERLKELQGRKEPRPGELAEADLEEEFEA